MIEVREVRVAGSDIGDLLSEWFGFNPTFAFAFNYNEGRNLEGKSRMRTLNGNCAGTLLSPTTPSTFVVLKLIVRSLLDHAIIYLPHPFHLLPHIKISIPTPIGLEFFEFQGASSHFRVYSKSSL
jgi:hypothetical protein